MFNNRKSKYKAAGFTLVEVVVVALIFSIVSIVAVSLYLAQKRLTSNEVKVTDMQVRMTAAINTVLPLLFEGSAILASATVNGSAYTTDTDTVILNVPSIDANNFALAGLNDKVALNHTPDGDLELSVEANTLSSRQSGTRVVFGGVESVEFTYEDPIDPTQSSWFDIKLTNNIQTSHAVVPVGVNYKATLRNK